MMVKQALRPETLPALQLATMAGAGAAVPGAILGGVAGGAGGLAVQALRRLIQTKREEKEDGEHSLLKGLLLGGVSGAALGGLGAGGMTASHVWDEFKPKTLTGQAKHVWKEYVN